MPWTFTEGIPFMHFCTFNRLLPELMTFNQAVCDSNIPKNTIFYIAYTALVDSKTLTVQSKPIIGSHPEPKITHSISSNLDCQKFIFILNLCDYGSADFLD